MVQVLIEPYWNVKRSYRSGDGMEPAVLIEPYWNVKQKAGHGYLGIQPRINMKEQIPQLCWGE